MPSQNLIHALNKSSLFNYSTLSDFLWIFKVYSSHFMYSSRLIKLQTTSGKCPQISPPFGEDAASCSFFHLQVRKDCHKNFIGQSTKQLLCIVEKYGALQIPEKYN